MDRKRNCCALPNLGNSSLRDDGPAPHVVWEGDELMEERIQSHRSGSESLSQVPAGWEQVWEGIPKARSLSEAPRGITLLRESETQTLLSETR